MNEQNQRDSIMSMARGAFEERVDYEMDKVIQNILDPNTKATAKRKITLTIELTPDDERRTIGVSVTAKSTLAATNPVATALAKADAPGLRTGFRGREVALIELRSLCIPNEGTAYLLDLLSRMTNENSVSTNDNGVTQTVEARQGVALNAVVEIKPRVMLRPFRTFLEVEQPESEFLLRVDPDEGIGFFEADGGIWKLEAKKNIADYFLKNMGDLIDAGKVVVMQ